PGHRHCASVLSFAFAAADVCHCMLLGASVPPHSSGFTWSMMYPGHRPAVLPVAGHGCCFLKLLIAALERRWNRLSEKGPMPSPARPHSKVTCARLQVPGIFQRGALTDVREKRADSSSHAGSRLCGRIFTQNSQSFFLTGSPA